MSLAACDTPPTGPALVHQDGVRGVTLVDWTPDGYGLQQAQREIDDIAASGANCVVLIVTAYQPHKRSSAVIVDPLRTPAVSAVRNAAMYARAGGLQVIIKPHVDVDDGSWRGDIEPANLAAWFGSYRDFILPWLDLATELEATHFVLGTELAGTAHDEPRWRQIARVARARFAGQLTYAASWDEAQAIAWWDALDVVGVDAYYLVASRRGPSRFELLAGWQPWLERLKRLSHKTGRDILVTEIGYRSVDGAGMHPYRFGAAGEVDLDEQADLYWAALQALGDRSWSRGVVWWNWPARGGGGSADADYTPSGKPAYFELQRAWSGAGPDAAPVPGPSARP